MAVPVQEKAALLDLFDATDGPYWFRNDGWSDPDAEPGYWFGVRVENGHVVGIDLSFGGLRGQLPASLANLPRLRFLHAVHNQLAGAIPAEIGLCASLQSLDLSNNALEGHLPSSLGALAELQSLSVHNNRLVGQIPLELGLCVSLRSLILSSNRLRGRIPATLAWCARLDTLWLFDNNLSGSAPLALGQLQALQQALLHDNNLSGVLPHTLARFDSLLVLRLADGEVASVSGSDEHFVSSFVSKQSAAQRCVLVTIDERVRLTKRVSVQLAHSVAQKHLRKRLRLRRSWRYAADGGAAAAAAASAADEGGDGGGELQARDLRRVREQRVHDLESFVRSKRATRVQAMWRGIVVRRIVRQWHAYATRIQAVARGALTRQRSLRWEPAAFTLQRAMRLFAARGAVRRHAAAVLRLQRWWRRTAQQLEASDEAWREYWTYHATVLQTAFRRHLARRALTVILIQRCVRGFRARRRARRERLLRLQPVMATRIQAAWRGWFARDRLETRRVQESLAKKEAETLFSMIRNGHVEALSAALADAKEAGRGVDQRDDHGNTPLLVAAQNGAVKAVRLCLAAGADVNAQNHAGCTPLHYAEYFHYDDVSALLWEHEAQDDIENGEGQTCYQMRDG